MTRLMMTMTKVPFVVLALTVSLGLTPGNARPAASGDSTNEVWSIDQSDSAGKNYGGTIYIWESKDLERVNNQERTAKIFFPCSHASVMRSGIAQQTQLAISSRLTIVGPSCVISRTATNTRNVTKAVVTT